MKVVITGANRGIGRALYDSYLARGETVIGTARGGKEGMVALDVTVPDSFATLQEAIREDPVDLLICNAGVYLDKFERLEDGYPAEQWADTFATNVTGVFQTVQTLLPNLLAAKGKIAILSSTMASHTHAPGGSYIYRASKAAVLNLGRNLATDLAAQGVAVGIYHPGWVKTDMGGDEADITVEEACAGLTQRFDALSMDTTGAFKTWDGQPHPF
ncbi:SDR family NAD(P)-dependent oxidoreductase [Aliiroseovarius crassostreae]|uniref:SDR family NAD(P)-dependent oxidoreductase n=1 Tax=Aliiroseovarius crassostreae TaxID=154981 RepID=UPI002202BDE3|nr:SDR family NAD(P)-dependent oxidoreductase [Aliiroseovarius crassostreae]UWP91309.1 SDR family NAD(P)-dependent oxidoreductase [Aliiroseovarius crassostreae]